MALRPPPSTTITTTLASMALRPPPSPTITTTLAPPPSPAATTTLAMRRLPSSAPRISLSSALEEGHLRWGPRVTITTGRGLALTCFARKPRKQRASRANMSDSDLREELLNFVHAEGLPEGHVPSTAELSKRGRKDLANIVRRRGHQIISELISNRANESTHPKENLSKIKDSDNKFDAGVETQDECLYASSETISVRSASDDLLSSEDSRNRRNGAYVVTDEPNEYVDLSENFRQVRDSAYDALRSQHTTKLSRSDAEHVLSNSEDFSNENRIGITQSATESEACKTLEIVGTGSKAAALSQFRNGVTLDQNMRNSFARDLSPQYAGYACEQTEINNLRAMLQEKEMELLQLRQEIEKEKLALSNLQKKSVSEMDYIQNLICQKDEELSAAEENLSGLREVLIEYQGQGETVEVAGSFNGWQHRIKMDCHMSVNLNPAESENCWKATLWLYPGVYEVKFIVDGHWKTDPRRESVTRGHITNNIIKVEG